MSVFGVGVGGAYRIDYGAVVPLPLALPPGVSPMPSALRPQPCFATWEGDTFVAGYFSRVLRWTSNFEFVASGIQAPPVTPTLAAGASSGGSTGENIGYVTFVQERPDGTIVHESNPAGPTAQISVTGQGFSWTTLPTFSVDDRVTHVYGYRSVDSALPRLAWKREIIERASSVTENVLTSELGQELPSLSSADGEEDVDTEARGVAPYCKIVVPFHNSLYYMGFPDQPHVIVPSKLFEPESVNLSPDSDTALVTPGREAVIGAFVHEATERLLVFCAGNPPRIYAITGFVGQDLDIKPVNSFYQLLSQAAIGAVGPDADLWFPTQEGPVLFNGSFRALMEDRSDEWKALLKANPDEFARCWSVFSNEERASGYKLRIPIADPESEVNLSYYFYGHDDPVSRGEQPWWTNDVRTRDDTCAAAVKPYGRPWAEVWTGSSDGYIRKEDVVADADDDDDTHQKRFDITHAHLWLPSQAGDDQHASRVTNVDLYMKNEQEAATVRLYPGDDSAAEAVEGFKAIPVPAGALPATQRQRVPLTSRRYGAGGIASGKGVAVRVFVDAPTDVEYRGMSVSYEDGSEQARLYSEE